MPWKKQTKALEVDVLNEHKKLSALTEQNGKFRYVQKVRGLRTYGVSFFNAMVWAIGNAIEAILFFSFNFLKRDKFCQLKFFSLFVDYFVMIGYN